MKILEKLQARSIPELILIGVISTSGVSLLIHVLSGGGSSAALAAWAIDWLRDFSTDLAGGGLTFLFIKWLLNKQSQELEAPPHKTTYVIEAEEEPPEITERVPVESVLPTLRNAATPEARQRILDRAHAQDQLTHAQLIDINLQKSDLTRANLYHADLTKANLRAAKLHNATLTFATLYMTQLIEANLQGADLSNANLERAYMSGASLSGANLQNARLITTLWGVDLRNANLRNADLRGAEFFRTDMAGADLTGALIEGAKINFDTTLPDGTFWDGKCELERFTNPEHTGYWRSDDPESPAYRGE